MQGANEVLEAIVTPKEMKIIRALQLGGKSVPDISKLSGFSPNTLMPLLGEFVEVEWLIYNRRHKTYSLNKKLVFKEIKYHNGYVTQPTEQRAKVELQPTHVQKPNNVDYKYNEIKSYTVTPEEAKQMFIDATKHLRNYEFKKGVFTPNENYDSVHRSR